MKARIVNIQKFSLHDGPGIRTLVFFKGCPLSCRWCANPECIHPEPEIALNKVICNRCGKCSGACPTQAITWDGQGLIHIDRSLCTACGECVGVCASKAMVVYGREVALAELFKEIRSDALFYGNTGGVTVSGGEPLLHVDFVESLFKMCRQAGITTAVETCGQVSPASVARIFQNLDFAFYDLKVMDTDKHLELTGRSNQLILDNARAAAQSGVRMQFRMPLIPGLNDDFANIKATGEFILSLEKENLRSIELMPYHRLGTGKYEALGREYGLKGLDMASAEAVESARKHFEEFGINCLVSR
jgi:pyruvate formate lyase activating enzyme